MFKRLLVMLFFSCVLFIGARYPANIPQVEPANKVELGERLFKEKKLSKNRNISCASCHIPEFAFADTIPLSLGTDNLPGKRNTPSVMNMSARSVFFYDGRAGSLEEQVSFPVEDHLEMDLSFNEAIKRIASDKNYRKFFKRVYNELPDENNIRDAISTFERSLETSKTPFDRWMNGDSTAMSAAAIRGRELFMNDQKTKCFLCHFSPDFTGDEFRNIGLYDGKAYNDVGRFAITCDSNDLGRFKTPGLRNVAMTAPYMHNGMFKTLKEVLDYYNDPFKTVKNPLQIDSLMEKPLGLSQQEISDLEYFLKALTDDRFLK